MSINQTKNVTVLGAGLVGSAMIKDLARDPQLKVTAVDLNLAALEKLRAVAPIATMQANLRAPGAIAGLVEGADLVVVAVPGFMGFETLKQVIEAGKPVVDISFFPEDPFALDELAKRKGVTAVVDCGVAPGLANILAGYVSSQVDEVESYLCYVGGLPQVRRWPYEYKVVFSAVDVIEEYTRPARYVEYGQQVIRPALTDIEPIDLPGAGTLEAFNTDGLRTLMTTLAAPFMKEKTLRFPGHANLMAIFRESGFFANEPVEVDGQLVRPLALTGKLLFDQWKLKEHEEDFTVMRVTLTGRKAGQLRSYTYDLYDVYDRETGVTSMARTTGYTCTIVARQVLNGLFTQQGICPPEFVGRTPGCYEDLISELAQRKITLSETHL